MAIKKSKTEWKILPLEDLMTDIVRVKQATATTLLIVLVLQKQEKK
jgi:hypothetical protein